MDDLFAFHCIAEELAAAILGNLGRIILLILEGKDNLLIYAITVDRMSESYLGRAVVQQRRW